MTMYRETDAYPCSTYGCNRPGIGVETRPILPNGMAPSVGFYGFCALHDPRGGRGWDPNRTDSDPVYRRQMRDSGHGAYLR